MNDATNPKVRGARHLYPEKEEKNDDYAVYNRYYKRAVMLTTLLYLLM
jgi:hypothetical protein